MTTKLRWPFALEEASSKAPLAKDQLRTGLARRSMSESILPVQENFGFRSLTPTKASPPSVALSKGDLQGLQQVKQAFRHDPATLARITTLEQNLTPVEQMGLWSRLGSQNPPDLSVVMAFLGIPDLPFLHPRKNMPAGKDLIERNDGGSTAPPEKRRKRPLPARSRWPVGAVSRATPGA
jgi:hypothetical protein